MSALTKEETKLANQTLLGKLGSRDSMQVKQAEDALNDFTRTKVREEGFFRRVIPPLPITSDELDRDVATDNPRKIVDREGNSPAAISIPFATQPTNLYIKGERYEVHFARIVTSRFSKDVAQLHTWIMDIRQVISDNAIKDMLAEEDSKFISAVNSAIVGPNLIVPTSGVVQYQQIAGGIQRDTLMDALKVIPNTPSNLEAHTILINQITIKDVMKITGDEMGGGANNMSQEIMRDGWTSATFMGKEWIITIKKTLVPTGTIFMFADPKFIGKNYELDPVTLFVKREAFMIEFYAWEVIGGAIGNTSGLARVDFV